MANYYCMMAGLPDIQLSDAKPLRSIDEMKEECEQTLTPKDKKVLYFFYLKWDCRNIVRLLKNPEAELEMLGNMTAEQYQDLIYKRMNAVQEPVAKLASDIVNVYSQTSDPGYVDFILENSQAAERHFFEKMAPLRKQLCQEWFASDQCQEIDRMDAPLVERALAERPRKAPSWFIEGRKAELEYVQSYNRYITERWIAKVRPYYEKDKAVLAKLLPYIKELEALHGDDPITIEYVGARIYARQWIESMLCRCYEWVMLINYAPLIQTPPTYESVKKFNKIKLR